LRLVGRVVSCAWSAAGVPRRSGRHSHPSPALDRSGPLLRLVGRRRAL